MSDTNENMNTRPKFYTAWFCPFAQRAWMGLIHKRIRFDYMEQSPYNKTPEWLALNPRGLVPAILYEGKVVWESTVCLEFIDEYWAQQGPPLLPKDPYERAHVRMWSDHINKKIVPPYYALLLKQNADEQEKCKQDIIDGLLSFTNAMSKSGPFFLGEDFGMVDIMLAPWAQRLEIVAKHYRDFTIPENDQFKRYYEWWRAVEEVPCYKATVQPTDKLIKYYSRYADDSVKSEVAEAVRQGKPLP